MGSCKLKCPVCGNKVFKELKYADDHRVINFEKRTIEEIHKYQRKKYYYCTNCNFKMYGKYGRRLRKEMEFLEEI